MEVHGFLNIDKPLGWTSHDVVGRLRRILATRRIGHAGALDPAATGVLVTGVGRATRFLDYVQQSAKQYVAHIVLGSESSTADIDGHYSENSQSHSRTPELKEILARLPELLGEIEQVPPRYSAIKQGGEPLYRRARRGEKVAVPVRQVRVDSLDVVYYEYPDLLLSITCGSGVYVRALARDLGSSIGCGAYLHHLLRTRVGRFNLDHAWTLDQLAVLPFPASWCQVATSIDHGISSSNALMLDRKSRDAWYHGRSIRTERAEFSAGSYLRTYTDSGEFAGIGTVTGSDASESNIQPRIVLAAH